MHHAGFHANRCQSLLGAFQPVFGRDTRIDERQLDIMQSGGASQQVEGLEHETDFLVADAGQFVVVEFAHQLRVQPIAAFAGSIEAADQVHQG